MAAGTTPEPSKYGGGVITHAVSTDPRSGDQLLVVNLEAVPPTLADVGDHITIEVTGDRYTGKIVRRRDSVMMIRCRS